MSMRPLLDCSVRQALAVASIADSAVYLLVAVMIYQEGDAFLRCVLPGELAAVFGGVMAGSGLAAQFDVLLGAVLLVVIASAVASDAMAHALGRQAGSSVLGHRVLVVRRERLLAVYRPLVHRPFRTMTLGRFTLFGRRVLPTLAGVIGISTPRFLLWSTLGGALWSCLYVLAGYGLGAVEPGIVKATAALFLLGVVVTVLTDAALWRLKGRSGQGS